MPKIGGENIMQSILAFLKRCKEIFTLKKKSKQKKIRTVQPDELSKEDFARYLWEEEQKWNDYHSQLL